jgi:hypothetical protein
MNYYVFYCEGIEVREYLQKTNFVGIWADTLEKAFNKCKSYMNPKTNIIYLVNYPSNMKIGYLY